MDKKNAEIVYGIDFVGMNLITHRNPKTCPEDGGENELCEDRLATSDALTPSWRRQCRIRQILPGAGNQMSIDRNWLWVGVAVLIWLLMPALLRPFGLEQVAAFTRQPVIFILLGFLIYRAYRLSR